MEQVAATFYDPERSITPNPQTDADAATIRPSSPSASAPASDGHDGSSGGVISPIPSSAGTASGSREQSPQQQDAQQSLTLEQELDEMLQGLSGMGASLGGLWGKVRKQSTSVLQNSRKEFEQYTETAKKDIAPYMTKARGEVAPYVDRARQEINPYVERARDEIKRLDEQSKEEQERRRDLGEEVIITADGEVMVRPNSVGLDKKDKGKGVERENQGDDAPEPSPSLSSEASNPPPATRHPAKSPSMAGAFFSRIQSQINSNPWGKNIQSQFQSLPEQIQSRLNIDPIRAQKLAEEYRSQAGSQLGRWGKDFEGFLKDAVRVVPPPDTPSIPESPNQEGSPSAKLTEHKRNASSAAGRKEGLLHRLQNDPAIVLVDPSQPSQSASSASSMEAFGKFGKEIEDQGGIEGDVWKAKISDALESAPSLQQSYDSVVPSKISANDFWTRYFFRVAQIDEDEARRKQVLEATQQAEDDFSWDVEEEEESENEVSKSHSSPHDTPKASGSATFNPANGASSKGDGSVLTTPRHSSDDSGTMSSYDLVSGSESEAKKQAVAQAAAAAATPTKPAQPEKPATNDDDDDDDSDWE